MTTGRAGILAVSGLGQLSAVAPRHRIKGKERDKTSGRWRACLAPSHGWCKELHSVDRMAQLPILIPWGLQSKQSLLAMPKTSTCSGNMPSPICLCLYIPPYKLPQPLGKRVPNLSRFQKDKLDNVKSMARLDTEF